MRSDIAKVVIERPRYNHKDPSKKTGQRIHRYYPGDEYEDLPQREPASRGRGTKYFTDFLNPLERFLRSNVGRPWDKVYSELCAHLDRRKTTGRHVFEHLEDFVEVNCFVGEDGELYASSHYGKVRAIGEYRWRASFYVDPRTKLLCLEKKRANKTLREARRRKVRNTIERKPISVNQSYLRINGIWYIADYAEDNWTKKEARPDHDPAFRYHDGKRWMQMVSKRKCSAQELQAAGLRNVPLKQ